MPRRPRIHVPGGFYHVTLRGNHQQDIFQTPADRALMESLLAHATRGVGARIHAYCWMTNHIHLLAEVGNTPLGALMQRISGPYARNMHKRFETTGHLFERRYYAQIVDTERYLLQVIRYTHFNPVRAGLAHHPDAYPWSSHRAYMGFAEYPWLTTEYALAMLGPTVAEARQAYRKYVDEAVGVTLESPFAEPDPNPVLRNATAAFLTCRQHAAMPSHRANDMSLAQLIESTCFRYGVTVAAAASTIRDPQLHAARTEIARLALQDGIANLSQVARALGRSAVALHKALRRRA